MLEEAKKYFKEDIIVLVLMFVCLFGGVFGAVNAADYIHPPAPDKGWREDERSYNARMEAYQQKLGQVGSDAVIPRVWAIPLTVVGLTAACTFTIVLLSRHAKP